jgi:hypothetical protein
MRILAANAVAIHTTSIVRTTRTVDFQPHSPQSCAVQALTDAIFDLAAYPDHISLMREEAEREVATQGWTKAALGNMHKIDSFLRESMRINSGPGV